MDEKRLLADLYQAMLDASRSGRESDDFVAAKKAFRDKLNEIARRKETSKEGV